MKENFITQKPSNLFLQKNIAYYYFHSSKTDVLHKKFLYYPNFKNALTVYQNSRVEFYENASISKPDDKVNFSFLYSGVQTQCRTAEIIAPFDKIGIVFQELGINCFIKKPLSTISNHPIDKSFNYYGDEFKDLCALVYEEKQIQKKVALLDVFFLNKYNEFEDERLKTSINSILESDEKIAVKELAKQSNISGKTLSRIFKKHVCCTPKDYSNIVQFRKALNDYLLLNENTSLTELAIDNKYYDLAQFINHFKKLTGINPKGFFKNVKHIGYEDTFWTFK